MENKLWNKEKSEEKLGESSDLHHTDNSLQNTTFDLFKPHVLSAIDNIREKKNVQMSTVFLTPFQKAPLQTSCGKYPNRTNKSKDNLEQNNK